MSQNQDSKYAPEPPLARKYWFYAKPYGWGWRASASWQGWAVRIVYAALVGAGIHFLLGQARVGPFCLYVGVLTVAGFGVCWWKGEPLRWRWGKD